MGVAPKSRPGRIRISTLKQGDLDRIAMQSRALSGCLSLREAKFLALVAGTLPPTLGELLEIGSFKGKSTTILAKAVQLAGGDRVVAVDPLTQSCETDPDLEAGANLPEIFHQTLQDNNVTSLVEFHQQRSEELAASWNRPIRFLWIDGDHTYSGASADVDYFVPYLQTGSIIAMHDVLHPAEGPIRAFCEKVLLSPDFGACGMCGSIGWSQHIERKRLNLQLKNRKLKLYKKLNRLTPYVAFGGAPRSVNPFGYRLRRPFVPHGDINPTRWLDAVRNNLSDT